MSSSNHKQDPFRYRLTLLINDAVRKAIRSAAAEADPSLLLKSCISCDYFKEDVEGCKISNMQRPPARVIAFGCAKWDSLDDDIPF